MGLEEGSKEQSQNCAEVGGSLIRRILRSVLSLYRDSSITLETSSEVRAAVWTVYAISPSKPQ